jgi:hypothetical protein
MIFWCVGMHLRVIIWVRNLFKKRQGAGSRGQGEKGQGEKEQGEKEQGEKEQGEKGQGEMISRGSRNPAGTKVIPSTTNSITAHSPQ